MQYFAGTAVKRQCQDDDHDGTIDACFEGETPVPVSGVLDAARPSTSWPAGPPTSSGVVSDATASATRAAAVVTQVGAALRRPRTGGWVLALETPQNYRKRPRQARSQQTVGVLLDATEEVLRTHGYSGASTNRIARSAGVSVGSLYQYFGDKDGLIGAALERALGRESDVLARLADEARERPLAEGVTRVVDAVVRSRIGQRALLAVLAEHGIRFGPGTTIQLVVRHQRGHPDPLQRLLAGRRAELREGSFETLVFSTSSLLQSASFGNAVSPCGPSAEPLVALLAAAITRHLVSEPAARGSAGAAVAALDASRVRALLHESCRSASARASLLDELVYEEQGCLDSLCAAGASPEAVCEGILRFWCESARDLARAAGASSLSGPALDPGAWALRAERRGRNVRGWLAGLHGGAEGGRLEAAVFVLGHAFLELGLLFAQAREPGPRVDERLADAAALLGHVARLAAGETMASAPARE